MTAKAPKDAKKTGVGEKHAGRPSAPLLLPFLLSRLPADWHLRLSHVLGFGKYVDVFDYWLGTRIRHDYPIRTDEGCRITHGDEVYILRFNRVNPALMSCRLAYWSRVEDVGRAPPERTVRVLKKVGEPPDDEVTLPFYARLTDIRLVWVVRPDESYQIAPLQPEDRKLDLEHTQTRPASQPQR